MNSAIQTAVILAGGSDRISGASNADLPSSLAPVGNQPFLGFLLEQLASTEIRRVILAVGARAEPFKQAFGGQFRRLRLEYCMEDHPLGTGGALVQLASQCEGDSILVMNGNSYCRFDLASMRRFHESRRAAATILVVPPGDADHRPPVHRNVDGAVMSGPMGRGNASAVSAGVYLLDRNCFANIPAGRSVSLERDVLPQWMGRGLFAHRTAGPFIDLGTAHAYSQAKVFFAVERAA